MIEAVARSRDRSAAPTASKLCCWLYVEGYGIYLKKVQRMPSRLLADPQHTALCNGRCYCITFICAGPWQKNLKRSTVQRGLRGLLVVHPFTIR